VTREAENIRKINAFLLLDNIRISSSEHELSKHGRSAQNGPTMKRPRRPVQNDATGTKRLEHHHFWRKQPRETAMHGTVRGRGSGGGVQQQDGRWQQLTWRPTVSLPAGYEEGERAVGSLYQPRIHGAINSHHPPGLPSPAEIQALSLMAMASQTHLWPVVGDDSWKRR
jgi:hypothetical protein